MKKSDKAKILRGILWVLGVIAIILIIWGIFKTFI